MPEKNATPSATIKRIEITRPSSGETSYYKVKDANSLIMTDSLGNEPEGAMAKHYVLTKKR